MSHIGVCTECAKRFKLPHLNKEWSCKACGGALLVQTPEAKKAPLRSRSTSKNEDRETNPFASEPRSSDEGRASRGSQPVGRDPQVIRKANRIHNGFGLFKVLLYFFLLGPVITIIGALIQFANGTYNAEAQNLFVAVDVAAAVFIVFALRSLRSIHGNPMPYAIVLAVLYLLNAAIFTWAEVYIVAGIMIVIAAIYLYFAFMAWQMVVLRRDHPEAFDAHEWNTSAARGRLSNPRSSGSERMEARRASGRRQSRSTKNRFGLILGGLFAVILVGIKTYTVANAPDNVANAVMEFHDAWNAGDFEELALLGKPGREVSWLGKFDRQNKKREWNGQPPKVDKGEYTEPKGNSVMVTFKTAKGPVRVRFGLYEKEWRFNAIDYRGLGD